VAGWVPRFTVHSLFIAVSMLAYVLTTRAERVRRPPAVAIAWVLGMMALPYLALPMYLMFGRRKLPRHSTRWSGKRSFASHWAEDLLESFGLPPAANATVRFHRDGAESRAGLLSTMHGASRRLDVCTYILGDDAIGREAVDWMIGSAQRGVRVRFLIDGVGALQVPRSWFRRLNAAGVETAVFSPLFARKTQGPRNLRNHRKWVVADGERLWGGGRNLAVEYFTGAGGAAAWPDLSFELAGPAAGAACRQFEADWEAAGGTAAADIPVPERSATGLSRTQFVPSGPDQMEDTVHALLIDGCFQATDRILAVSPYFVPDVSLENAMRLAVRRGVKIDLCIPRRSNHLLADFVRNRALRSLCAAGVTVHLLPAMNHAKAVVFDDTLALCGSCNLDSRSLLLNYESMVVFYGASEIAWLGAWISALIPAAAPFDCRPPSLWRDVGEGLLLTVAYQL
jgi:cardiolipin synthase